MMANETFDVAALAWPLLAILAGGATGLAAGAFYFEALRRSAASWAEGGEVARTLAASLARVAIAVALFVGLAAGLGPLAALSGLAGFAVARSRALAGRTGAKKREAGLGG